MGRRELRIDVKLVVLCAALITLIIIVVGFWSANTHEQQLREELVEQARGFSKQMDAVWTFVDANQDRINYTTDGIYEFKGLHCSVAAKAVAQLFSRNTDYVVKFTRESPRNAGDMPDEWELNALTAFEEDPSIGEYYQLVDTDGLVSLRYCTPLVVEEGCLSCHGTPKGEMDITGYAKEGWGVGDLAGALSISIPAEEYINSYNASLARDLLYYSLAMCAALAVLFFAVRHLVTKPLHSVVDSLDEVGRGRIDMKLPNSQSTKEISTVICAFNAMTDELDTLYGSLEQQVADRTERLQKLSEQAIAQREEIKKVNERLKKESTYKSDFLATMSHELKTPLTATISYLEALQSNQCTLTSSERKLAANAEASSKELLLIINNILETSRSTTMEEHMNWEMVDLLDFTEYLLHETDPLAARKDIAIERYADPACALIYSDWGKLRHIVINLLSNAIKFSNAGSTVTLRTIRDSDAQHVRIEVADNGIGIAPEDIEGIFDRFSQTRHTTNANPDGSGLGLYIVKEYTQLLGGMVTVQSKIGYGSTFTLILPIHPEGAPDENHSAY